MPEDSKHLTHTIQGTIAPEAWVKFFKEHFVKSPAGGGIGHPVEAAAKSTGSCTDVGCPSKHPISGTRLNGCSVEISHGRVVSVNCHYDAIAR